MSNAERLMLKEEVEVRIPSNLIAWRTESNLSVGRQVSWLLHLACLPQAGFCTVLILDTSDLILLKIRNAHTLAKGIKSKGSGLIGAHVVHIQICSHCISHSEQPEGRIEN